MLLSKETSIKSTCRAKQVSRLRGIARKDGQSHSARNDNFGLNQTFPLEMTTLGSIRPPLRGLWLLRNHRLMRGHGLPSLVAININVGESNPGYDLALRIRGRCQTSYVTHVAIDVGTHILQF